MTQLCLYCKTTPPKNKQGKFCADCIKIRRVNGINDYGMKPDGPVKYCFAWDEESVLL